MTLPFLLMTLHLSQMGLTEGLTFIFLSSEFFVLALVSVRYSAFVKVVRAHCHLNFVSYAHADGVLTHFSAQIRRNNVIVGQLNLKIRPGQYFHHHAFDFDYVVL